MLSPFDVSSVDWAKGDGLVPAIVQDVNSLRVLMLGYVNQESLQKTLASGLVTFYSRSQKKLWQKGETSGNILRLIDIRLDCDSDTLLLLVKPEGPTCHLGTTTCFGEDCKPSLATIADLAATIEMRRHLPEPNSYTARLFEEGLERIAQKVGEEAVETAIAAVTKSPSLTSEAADLVYHLLVLLEISETSFADVLRVLHDRAQGKKKK